MSQQALYCIIEQGREQWFHAQWGANELSPLMRLQQAYELQAQIPEHPGITNIFEHLTRYGEYKDPPAPPEELFCTPIIDFLVDEYQKNYEADKEIEMRVTLDLDNNTCRIEYNRKVFPLLEDHTLPIDEGLKNVKLLFASAEEKGLFGFSEVYDLYLKVTGLDEAYRRNRAYQDVQFNDARAAAAQPQAEPAADHETEGLDEP